MWQTVFHISGAAVRCLLKIVHQNPNLTSFSNSIPVTIITAEKKLGQQENIGGSFHTKSTKKSLGFS